MNLNQQLAEEITKIISDISYYSCIGNTITKVNDICVCLDEDYASNIVEEISFNGSAEFWYVVPNGELSTRCNFRGKATIQDFKVANICKPIIIHIN